MGIDYSGNMIVGCKVKYIDLNSVLPEGMDFSDWCEKHGMIRMAPYYDADTDSCTVGFKVDDVEVDKIDSDWVASIQALGSKFTMLTGRPAKLIGTQDIW